MGQTFSTPITATCTGGTLLTIGAAALAREQDQRLGSITLFAAQTDFSEPGELAYFINPAQLAMLQVVRTDLLVVDSTHSTSFSAHAAPCPHRYGTSRYARKGATTMPLPNLAMKGDARHTHVSTPGDLRPRGPALRPKGSPPNH